MNDKKRLGKGLEALLGAVEKHEAEQPAQSILCVPIEQIEANPFQPRKDVDPQALQALKQSLETHGLLQPILVRPTNRGYQVVVGERRLRAAREAGWKEIPVRIVDFNDQLVFEAALIENLHRTDLNPLEKAQGFAEYCQRYGVTHEELARRLGMDRSTVTNFIRLLDLPPAVQEALRMGQISFGHARALLGLHDPQRQEELCRQIIANGLSVRAVEHLVRQEAESTASPSRPATESQTSSYKTPHVQAIENELRQRLATRVDIRLRGKEKGQIVLHFQNNEDFERLLDLLRR
ncbi:MAG: ParB/RepB/Spo0J family partition protein [Gemmatales bacterium]|nr:ParB/RepB/Spo0J family partition protein [Gemmatales bacterium]MDW7993798.1 ParB/RepB/Spo0J family partition protein [Gemmatales bacterium]